MNDTTLAVVLWGAAVLILGWTWVPALVSGLGGTKYANGGTDDPTALEPAAREHDYAYWHRQILALGYEPLGPAWMRITFHGPQWRYDTQVRVFYSRSKRVFAFVQKQPRPMDVWWLTMFATCWQDGGILLTNNATDEPPGEGEYIVQGMETFDLAAAEELHLGEQTRLEGTGKRADTDGSLEALLKSTERYAGQSARYVSLRLGQTYLATHGFIHFFMSLPPAILVGPGHWGVPLANIVLGLVFNLSEYLAKWRAGAVMREQLKGQPAGPAEIGS
jgi:hypothetical protein